ncbi:MAG: hypothetical protein M0R46_10895 [Candidatus Muirbacterium halophilum]|nr:hypothetical protein [Candidatus Muirbacterium halophilum]
MKKIFLLICFNLFFINIFSLTIDSQKEFIENFLKKYKNIEKNQIIKYRLYEKDNRVYKIWVKIKDHERDFDFHYSKKSLKFIHFDDENFPKNISKEEYLDEDILQEKAINILEEVFNINIKQDFLLQKEYIVHLVEEYKESKFISFEFIRKYQGYPSKNFVRIGFLKNGDLLYLMSSLENLPKIRKYNLTVSREEAKEIALKDARVKLPDLFNEYYYTYLKMSDYKYGQGAASFIGSIAKDFRLPWIIYTDSSYILDYRKNIISKLLKKYFPRYPKLVWYIYLRFRDERMIRAEKRGVGNITYNLKNGFLCYRINAETGKIIDFDYNFVNFHKGRAYEDFELKKYGPPIYYDENGNEIIF